MKKRQKKKQGSIKFKILAVPLIILFIVITLLTVMSIWVINSSLIKQMKVDGMDLADQIKSQIETNQRAITSIDQALSDKIRTTGEFLLSNSDEVSNEYLTIIAKHLEVDEINYIDSNGKIIHSNMASSIGYIFDNDHIAYQVINGKEKHVNEEIRQSSKTEDYFKYGYVGNGIATIQIGINANTTQSLKKAVEIQTLMDQLVVDSNIVYATFIDTNLMITAHSDQSRIGLVVDDIGSKTAAVKGEAYSSTYMYKGNTKVYDVLVPIFIDGKHLGAVDIGISMESVATTVNQMIVIILLISLISFIIAIAILIKISLGVTRPLKILVEAAKNIADGDLTHNIEVKSHDEIGVLFQSFDTMKEHLKNTLTSIKEGSSEVKSLSTILNSNAQQMTLASSEVSNAIQEVAKGAESQAKDLVDVSNHASRLGDELESINIKIESVKASSNTTEEKATIGKQQMDHLLTTIEQVQKSFIEQANLINHLNESVSKVSNITDFITEISSQTNLLALNAAIEAARAGETGKGFAVISDEVRKLAEESKVAAVEIQRLIETIGSETKEVLDNSKHVAILIEDQSGTVNHSMKAFHEILTALTDVSPLIMEVYHSLQTTMESKSMIIDSVDNVTSVAQETSASSEEIAASSEEALASSEEVASYAERLATISNILDSEANKFAL